MGVYHWTRIARLRGHTLNGRSASTARGPSQAPINAGDAEDAPRLCEAVIVCTVCVQDLRSSMLASHGRFTGTAANGATSLSNPAQKAQKCLVIPRDAPHCQGGTRILSLRSHAMEVAIQTLLDRYCDAPAQVISCKVYTLLHFRLCCV